MAPVQNSPSVLTVIATAHGPTMTSTRIRPQAQPRVRAHGALRSQAHSIRPASSATIGPIGPLSRMRHRQPQPEQRLGAPSGADRRRRAWRRRRAGRRRPWPGWSAPHSTASVLAMPASVDKSRVLARMAPAARAVCGREKRAAPQAQGGGGQHGAQQRGDAVGPDLAGLRRGQGLDGGGLQPVDRHRLLVARLVLVADADEVAGLQHLGGGLGEQGFVAVERRQGDQARQSGDQRDERGQERPAPAARHPVEASLLRHRGFDSTNLGAAIQRA